MIPEELKQYRQFVVWKYEEIGREKPTKVPYNALTGFKASVTNPNDWVSFDEACQTVGTHYNGIGFVLTKNDPYAIIDLDKTDNFEHQIKIYNEFNSYSEISPSGFGLHIVVKGCVPTGKRRDFVEVYSSDRYITFTGNVYNDVPIQERQSLLDILYEEMGGNSDVEIQVENKPQITDDSEIINMACRANNGDKFYELYYGDFRKYYGPAFGHQGEGQSEADFALIDMLAFYTRNHEQIRRLFLASKLGERQKAKRGSYVNNMIQRAFDRQLPEIDLTALQEKLRGAGAAIGEVRAAIPSAAFEGKSCSHIQTEESSEMWFPPGLLGDISRYVYKSAPRPVPQIALVAAIGMMAGICGRQYNISNAGLNQYVMLIAKTGTGKDAIHSGISDIVENVAKHLPTIRDFAGPSDFRSDAALIKWLAKKPCFFSIIGEFGLRIKRMSSERASSHEVGLQQVLLDVYSKSGIKGTLQPIAYSDKEKNTEIVQSPSLTIIGESTPSEFYSALDEKMIASGLLPRCLIIEYKGGRVKANPDAGKVFPDYLLLQNLSALTAQCHSLANNKTIQNVTISDEARQVFDEFNLFCDGEINKFQSEVSAALWNRAHLKAMKLAALVSVGINYINPSVEYQAAVWATNIVFGDIQNILDRFESDEIGKNASEETAVDFKQQNKILQTIKEYIDSDFDKFKSYGSDEKMHKSGVIKYSILQRRLVNIATFKNDRRGATVAIKQTIKSLIDEEAIKLVSRVQMLNEFSSEAEAYAISDMARYKTIKVVSTT